MSRIPCMSRSKSLHNVSRPTYIARGQRPRNIPCPQAPPPSLLRQRLQGQQRQYSPSEFGLSPNEQFQDAQIFRDLDFNTDRAALEQLRGPVRPAYQPPRAPRLSGLPNECLDEVSFPSSNNSARLGAASQGQRRLSGLTNECLDDVSFPSLNNSARSGAASQRQSPQQMENECIDDVSAPSILKSLSSGVISCLDEINDSFLGDESVGRGGASASFRPGPQSPPPDECIADIPYNQSQGNGVVDCPQNEQEEEGSGMESLYTNVLQRFEALKRRMADEKEAQKSAQQNNCISGAGKSTTTQINTNAGDIVKETVVEKSIIENGEIQTTTRHIITRRDACGNETSECNECKETSVASPEGMERALANQRIPPHHETPSCGDPFMLRLAGDVKRRLDFQLPGEITEGPCPPCDEQLGDESAPLFANSFSSTSRRSLSLPSEQLGEMSGPSFASSLPSSVGPECLDDISAPSLEMGSPISPFRKFPRMPSLPSQQLSDMSAPSFERSMASPAQSPEECFDPCARSMSMRSSPGQRSQQSQQICDMPATSPAQRQSQSFRGSFPSPVQQECLADVSAPAFARSMSMRSSPRQRSQPGQQICDMPARSPAPAQAQSFRDRFASTFQQECLDDVSAPSFERSISMRSSPRMRSLPSDQICDMPSPSFGSSLPSSISPDCLDDISAPSLQMGSPISPFRKFPRMPSLPSQQLSDMSAPSFERSMPSPECAGTPNYSQYTDVSPPSPFMYTSNERSLPSTFSSAGRIDPEMAAHLARSFVDSPMSYENNGNYTSISSMFSSPRRIGSDRDRSLPSQFSSPSRINSDIAALSLCDTTAPSYGGQSPSPRQGERQYNMASPMRPQRRSLSLPREQLCDVSAPSLTRSMSMRSSPRVHSLPSDQICDMPSPSFGSSLPSSISPECLDDESAPSLEMGSPISPFRKFPRMPSLPSQQLSNVSAPSFERSMPSPAPAQIPQECFDNVNVRSPARSMSMRSSPQRRSQPSQQMPAPSPAQRQSPSFRGSFPSPVQQECLADVSAPVFARSMSMRSSPRQRSQPSQQICDMPARSPTPAPAQAQSFRDRFASTFQQECLDDVSAPSFQRSISMRSSPRMRSLPSDQICDMPSPSFGSSLPSSVNPDCLDDVSAPSLQMGSPISPFRIFPRMPSLPSQQLSDVSAPSFERSMPSPAPAQSPQRRSQPSQQMPAPSPAQRQSPSFRGSFPSPVQQECLADVSPPVFARSMSMRSSPRQRSQPSQQICEMPAPSPAQRQSPSFRGPFPSSFQQDCLDDVSAPSFARSVSMRSSPRMRSLPSGQISDMSAPTFGSSLPSSILPDFLSDESAPDLQMGSPISPLRIFPRMPSLPSQQLSDMSSPVFSTSGPEECSEDFNSSVRSSMRTPATANYAQYADVSLPSPFTPLSRITSKIDNSSIPCEGVPERSLPSMFSSQSGPVSYDRYAQYADVSLPSTFDRPIRGPGTPFGGGPTEPNARIYNEPPQFPDNTYKETLEITASVHSIATLTINDNRNISEISQPSYATVESSNQSTRSNANQNSLRGFDTMPNYMPFEEQMRSCPAPSQRPVNLNITNPFD